MAKNNRVCICCGKEYSYCRNCYKDMHKPAYMAIYCSENCKNIFDAASKYFCKELTKEEAKEIIMSCDLSNLDNFNENVKNDVKKIIDKKASKKKDETEEKQDEFQQEVVE